MKALAISLLISIAVATISQARPPLFSKSSETIVSADVASSPAPPLAGSENAPGVAQSRSGVDQYGPAGQGEACGTDDCSKCRLFHHHNWSLSGHFSGKHCSWFHGLGLGGFSGLGGLGGGHGGGKAPTGDAAFPTHPYARSPRDFFMME